MDDLTPSGYLMRNDKVPCKRQKVNSSVWCQNPQVPKEKVPFTFYWKALYNATQYVVDREVNAMDCSSHRSFIHVERERLLRLLSGNTFAKAIPGIRGRGGFWSGGGLTILKGPRRVAVFGRDSSPAAPSCCPHQGSPGPRPSPTPTIVLLPGRGRSLGSLGYKARPGDAASKQLQSEVTP